MLRSLRSAWIAPIVAVMVMACGPGGETNTMEETEQMPAGEGEMDTMGGEAMPQDTMAHPMDTAAPAEGM